MAKNKKSKAATDMDSATVAFAGLNISGSPTPSSTSTGTKGIPISSAGPSYFDNFPGFVPHPQAKFTTNFKKLAKQMNWSPEKARKERINAIQLEFNFLYGTDTNKLENWQDLCREVGIVDVPGSITKCRKALGGRKVMVNIVNLVDHRRRGVLIKTFANYTAFREYTLNGNTFPREEAKAEGFLKALLRHVIQ